MLMRKLFLLCTILFFIDSVECKRRLYFVYNGLGTDLVGAARSYGAEMYQNYLNATENLSSKERLKAFPDYFEKCNDLGWEFTDNVSHIVKNQTGDPNILILKKIGMADFLAQFLTLKDDILKDGIKQLCMKTELQFQCQLGFGESRSRIQLRIQNLKRYDGDMKLLLEKDCNLKTQHTINYPCVGHKAIQWTSNCTKVLDEYNETRTAVNDKIYTIYTQAINHSEQVTKNANPDDTKQFIPTTIIVQNILKKALNQIRDLESEKCRKLSFMLTCVVPELEKECGTGATDALKTSILVGYLRSDRGTSLQYHFEQLDIDSDPICLALHKDV